MLINTQHAAMPTTPTSPQQCTCPAHARQGPPGPGPGRSARACRYPRCGTLRQRGEVVAGLGRQDVGAQSTCPKAELTARPTPAPPTSARIGLNLCTGRVAGEQDEEDGGGGRGLRQQRLGRERFGLHVPADTGATKRLTYSSSTCGGGAAIPAIPQALSLPDTKPSSLGAQGRLAQGAQCSRHAVGLERPQHQDALEGRQLGPLACKRMSRKKQMLPHDGA